MRKKLYVGCVRNGPREIIRSLVEPTETTHGDKFSAVIGPFRTITGARFMRDYGTGNPHVQCVADAERLSKVLQ